MEPSVPKRAKIEEDGKTDLENEVKFEYWESLPLEIRCMIAKETGVVTRFSLMFSSKSNYQIARSVPIKIESIEVCKDICVPQLDVEDGMKNIHIVLKKFDPSDEITAVCFLKEKNATMVYRHWWKNDRFCAAKLMILSNIGYYEASMSFLENLMKLTDYQMDEFDAGVSDWGHDFVFLERLRIRKTLSIMTSDGRTFNRWLDTANSPLEKLTIFIPREYDYQRQSEQINLKHNTIKNSKELDFTNYARSFDKLDFYELNWDKFSIDALEITPEAINMFVKKWVDGNVRISFSRGDFWNSKFTTYDNCHQRSLSGLNSSPWRNEYRIGEERLCEFFDCYYPPKHSNCYYIETKNGDNGAALVLKEIGAVFLVSGKQNI